MAQRRVRCSLPPQGRLCWPGGQLEPPRVAKHRVRCSLPPQVRQCWPGGQLEPPRVAKHRMRCSLPSPGGRCWPGSQPEPHKVAQHQAYCNLLPLASSCTAFVRARCALTFSLRRRAVSGGGPRLPTTNRARRPCACMNTVRYPQSAPPRRLWPRAAPTSHQPRRPCAGACLLCVALRLRRLAASGAGRACLPAAAPPS